MAATKVDEAFIELLLKDKKFKAGMKNANKQMTSFGKTAKSVGKIFGGFLAVGAITNFMRASVQLSRQQAKAEAKLGAVLKATGGAAGQSASGLKAHAAALQELTGVGDEVIIDAQAMLATFTKIQGPVFNQATQAALDLSAAFGTDLKGSIIQVGKALQDPIRGITALSRVGVSFSAEQKELIKGFMELNDLASAQGVILAELKQEFGGSAEAMATDVQKLASAWGDVKEAIGESVLKLASFVVDVKLLVSLLRSMIADTPGAGHGKKVRAVQDEIREIKTHLDSLIIPGFNTGAMRDRLVDLQLQEKRLLGGGTGSEQRKQQGAATLAKKAKEDQGALDLEKSRKELQLDITKQRLDELAAKERRIETGSQGMVAAQKMFNFFSRVLPTEKQSRRAKGLMEGLEEKGGTAKYFGLSDFSKAIQESIGKPDEQKSRDEKRDDILVGVRDLTGQLVAEFKGGLRAVFE